MRHQPSPVSTWQPNGNRALPGEGEPESSAEVLGSGTGVQWERMGEERAEEGPCGFIYWRGALGKLAVRSWRSGQGLAGRAVASQGWVQACATLSFLEGCRWPEVARWTCHFVQSNQRAGVRWWRWRSNGQGRGSSCASGVLELSPARVREREGQGGRGVGFRLVSRSTWPERVGGAWAAWVRESGNGLAWGTREVLGCCCAR
jgi:hypothetical protein